MQMDVLDARVVEHDLVTKEDAPTHVDAVGVELVTHRVVAKIEQRQEDWESYDGEHGLDEITGHQLFYRALYCGDVRWYRRRLWRIGIVHLPGEYTLDEERLFKEAQAILLW